MHRRRQAVRRSSIIRGHCTHSNYNACVTEWITSGNVHNRSQHNIISIRATQVLLAIMTKRCPVACLCMSDDDPTNTRLTMAHSQETPMQPSARIRGDVGSGIYGECLKVVTGGTIPPDLYARLRTCGCVLGRNRQQNLGRAPWTILSKSPLRQVLRNSRCIHWALRGSRHRQYHGSILPWCTSSVLSLPSQGQPKTGGRGYHRT